MSQKWMRDCVNFRFPRRGGGCIDPTGGPWLGVLGGIEGPDQRRHHPRQRLRLVAKDNGEPGYALPAATTIAGGGYLVVEEAHLGSGLGSADSARLLAADGTTLLDFYSWTVHATTTYGRCPNGTGSFTTTQSATKGAAAACPGDVDAGRRRRDGLTTWKISIRPAVQAGSDGSQWRSVTGGSW